MEVIVPEADNGTVVWEADTVYGPSWDHELIYTLDAAMGARPWCFDLVWHPYQSPVVVDGTVFVGGAGRRGRLYAVTGE